MKKTAIYLRVSTDKQAKEGDSIPAQRDALMKYISDHSDLIFAGEYMDDGISGTKADRDEYQRLLADVAAGRIDLVLVTKLDRIHRGLKNFLIMQELFEKHGCSWLAIWEPMYDSSTPQGKMIINTMVNLAQFEAENTGQRIRQVFEYKRGRGETLGGKLPYGYKIVDKHLVPDEHAADVVAIFEHFAGSGSLGDTVRYASAFGYDVSRTAMKGFLSNPVYIGDRGSQPTISTDLWNRVQVHIQHTVKSNCTTVYVFSGLLICAECGKRMGACRRKSKYSLYRCQLRYNRALSGCSNRRTLYERALERLLLDQLPGMIEEQQRQVTQEAARCPDSSKQIAAIRRKIDRLKELYIAEEITLDEYRADKARYMQELGELEKMKTDAEPSKILTLDVSDLRDRYYSWGPEARRSFWRGIIREIRFDKDRQITVEFL